MIHNYYNSVSALIKERLQSSGPQTAIVWQRLKQVKNAAEEANLLLLGAFAKLRKATISFVMSVCPHGKTRLPPDGFS
jgi:hypothetical protein